MIVSFRDDWLRAFFVDDIRSKKIPPDLESRLFRKLEMIDDATTDQDLRIPPSNHFEKLRGDLEGLHSIRVNKQWRLIFQWVGAKGEATNIYHGSQLSMRQAMLMTKRKPATVTEILVEEFMAPMGLTQAGLAERMAFNASTSTNCATSAGP